MQEPPSADFIARIRDELTGTLTQVREAAALPWKDLTAATLAELQFNSIAGWLPEDEANALRTVSGRNCGASTRSPNSPNNDSWPNLVGRKH